MLILTCVVRQKKTRVHDVKTFMFSSGTFSRLRNSLFENRFA